MGTRINDVSPTVKLVLMLGEYMHRHYHGRYHSKAQNLRGLLRRAYDEAQGLAHPRIWTAKRDVEMWKALQG